MSKCPSCGYEYTPGDKKPEIRRKLFSKGKKARKMLTKAGESIMKYVPSDNKDYKFYAFLHYISTINDEIIIHTTKIYLNHEEYKKGNFKPSIGDQYYNETSLNLHRAGLDPSLLDLLKKGM